MAEIKNYTLNFVSGRRASRGLTCLRKLAYNEIELRRCCACRVGFDWQK
jgi:hypothetical protein